MPRSNRPRSGRARRDGGREEPEPLDLERIRVGSPRVERRADGDWRVQPHRGRSDGKSYRCPGCGLDIVDGTAHLVVWRADGILGEANDLAARRHWHSHCWRIRR